MGKKTLYHPVSLHVIRGAAEYCGFTFGKLQQLHHFSAKESVRYNATILGVPPGWDLQPMDLMQAQLQECFLDDIRVYWLRLNRLGYWMCHLQVQTPPNDNQFGESVTVEQIRTMNEGREELRGRRNE
jgi:hypothetical protein